MTIYKKVVFFLIFKIEMSKMLKTTNKLFIYLADPAITGLSPFEYLL